MAFPIKAAALRDRPNGNVSKSSPIETTKTYAARALTSPVAPAIKTKACMLKFSKNNIKVPGIAKHK